MVYRNFRQLRACLILKMRGQENTNIAGLDGSWSRATMFFFTVWFQRVRCKALQLVAIVGNVYSPVVKSVPENGMEAEIWGLVSVVQVMVAMRFWLRDSWLGAAASASVGDNTREIHSLSLNLQGENPRSSLNWLCMTMVLLNALFYEHELSSGWKPMIYD
jgi:hypothetical protein